MKRWRPPLDPESYARGWDSGCNYGGWMGFWMGGILFGFLGIVATHCLDTYLH